MNQPEQAAPDFHEGILPLFHLREAITDFEKLRETVLKTGCILSSETVLPPLNSCIVFSFFEGKRYSGLLRIEGGPKFGVFLELTIEMRATSSTRVVRNVSLVIARLSYSPSTLGSVMVNSLPTDLPHSLVHLLTEIKRREVGTRITLTDLHRIADRFFPFLLADQKS